MIDSADGYLKRSLDQESRNDMSMALVMSQQAVSKWTDYSCLLALVCVSPVHTMIVPYRSAGVRARSAT